MNLVLSGQCWIR